MGRVGPMAPGFGPRGEAAWGSGGFRDGRGMARGDSGPGERGREVESRGREREREFDRRRSSPGR